MSSALDATALARAVVQRLLDDGVTELVVAPGSRNAPLSFAAFDAAEAGLLRLHTRVDERSAAFLALGLAKVGRPAAVVCTSGTAVANLHPAVLEAVHARVPLVAVTADRPRRLSGTSANQTTDQVGVFGPLVASADLERPTDLDEVPALAPHLNVRLDDPLVPADRWTPVPPAGARPDRRRWDDVPATPLALGPRTVVVAGDDAGPPARTLAEAAGWPLLAEPTSGARTGTHALRSYRVLLATGLADEVERVVVVGHPTLSRPVARLLARPDVEVVEVGRERSGLLPHPFPVAASFDRVAVDGSDDPDWLDRWRDADRSVSRQVDALLAAEPRLTPYEVAAAVHRSLPPGGMLVVGASNPIRDLDLVARPHPVGERRRVVANRGLAGIDGVVSTAVGAALARPQGRSLALLGDVTFLHDAGGLVRGPGQPEPDLTLVVVNDDGGSIFSVLEQGDPAHADRFEALFGTPHGVDLAALCAATRTPHWRVESLPELEQALRSPNGGIEVVEVRVRRDDRRELDARLRALRP